MKAARKTHTSFSVEEKYVYIYGGTAGANDNECLRSFERLQLNEDLSGDWQTLEVDTQTPQMPSYYIMNLKKSEDEFLIIGGRDSTDSYTADCAVYNWKTNTMSVFPLKLSYQYCNLYGTAVTYSNQSQDSPYYLAVDNNDLLRKFDQNKWTHNNQFLD